MEGVDTDCPSWLCSTMYPFDRCERQSKAYADCFQERRRTEEEEARGWSAQVSGLAKGQSTSERSTGATQQESSQRLVAGRQAAATRAGAARTRTTGELAFNVVGPDVCCRADPRVFSGSSAYRVGRKVPGETRVKVDAGKRVQGECRAEDCR